MKLPKTPSTSWCFGRQAGATYSGLHGKLGELIGLTVMESMRKALKLNEGLSEESQHSLFARLKRYRVTEETFIERFAGMDPMKEAVLADYIANVHAISANSEIITLASLFIHLLDQLGWGLLAAAEAANAAELILNSISSALGRGRACGKISAKASSSECIDEMLLCLVDEIAACALGLTPQEAEI
ncbi:MAG: hypothetical protein FWG30_09365 [Eubacteriaceae bacterium]|nr:hypothetical protein [Eubacteriaceae bacterium]